MKEWDEAKIKNLKAGENPLIVNDAKQTGRPDRPPRQPRPSFTLKHPGFPACATCNLVRRFNNGHEFPPFLFGDLGDNLNSVLDSIGDDKLTQAVLEARHAYYQAYEVVFGTLPFLPDIAIATEMNGTLELQCMPLPGFRARRNHEVRPWLTESDGGANIVHYYTVPAKKDYQYFEPPLPLPVAAECVCPALANREVTHEDLHLLYAKSLRE